MSRDAMNTDDDARNGGQPKWWRKAILVILTPIVLPISIVFVGIPLCVLAVLSWPSGAIGWQLEKRRERRFYQAMSERGRSEVWAALANKLTSQGGTVLIEWRPNKPMRLWWTPDDVLACAPCTPAPMDELDFFLCGRPIRSFFGFMIRILT